MEERAPGTSDLITFSFRLGLDCFKCSVPPHTAIVGFIIFFLLPQSSDLIPPRLHALQLDAMRFIGRIIEV
ncbi:unnamed protein product [Boreogadus saida]